MIAEQSAPPGTKVTPHTRGPVILKGVTPGRPYVVESWASYTFRLTNDSGALWWFGCEFFDLFSPTFPVVFQDHVFNTAVGSAVVDCPCGYRMSYTALIQGAMTPLCQAAHGNPVTTIMSGSAQALLQSAGTPITPQNAPAGTVVKCVDDSGIAQGVLQAGMDYVVHCWTAATDIQVTGVAGGWLARRFVLAGAATKSAPTGGLVTTVPAPLHIGTPITPQNAPPGTMVRCIDNSAFSQNLTIGSDYRVQDWLASRAVQEVLLERDDRFSGVPYRAHRFVLAGVAAAAIPGPIDDGWDIHTPPLPRPVAKTYPTCPVCEIELLPDLDAYYGPHENLRGWCSKCRRELDPSST